MGKGRERKDRGGTRGMGGEKEAEGRASGREDLALRSWWDRRPCSERMEHQSVGD